MPCFDWCVIGQGLMSTWRQVSSGNSPASLARRATSSFYGLLEAATKLIYLALSNITAN